MLETFEQDNVVQKNKDIYNKKTVAVPKPQLQPEKDDIIDTLISAGEATAVNLSAIDSFSMSSQRRDELYALLDVMAEDSTISAILEKYVEDATERNDNGNIIWAESGDANIQTFVNFLLRDLEVDKHAYSWVYNLCKYGDLYLKLYRKSEVEDDLFKDVNQDNKQQLREAIQFKAYSPSDKFAHYVEAVNNPAEIFELTKYGKTVGFIKAPVHSPKNYSTHSIADDVYNYNYAFNQDDIEVSGSTEYVHAALGIDTNRMQEKVDIFRNDNNTKTADYSYSVRKGKSLLYDSYKSWRELQLLENAILLNRLTKSSIVRVVQVEVGDQPKNQIPLKLRQIKNLVEQKSSLSEANSMGEYTNPGPIDNTIYIPTRNGIGGLTLQTIGGDDVDVGKLTDLDYFRKKQFASFRVPPQYFGYTDDAGGFDGGTSLSIISSSYAKMIKQIQSCMCMTIESLINILLIDKGLDSYVGKFEIKMLAPTTREELDRRENTASKIQLVRDVLDLVEPLEEIPKLEIMKHLLSNTIEDPEVIAIIDAEIKKKNAEVTNDVDSDGDDSEDYADDNLGSLFNDEDTDFGGGDLNALSTPAPTEGMSTPSDTQTTTSEETISSLPSMADTDIDFSDNNIEF